MNLGIFDQMEQLSDHLSEYDLIIAIDGHAACGKSTLAKALAAALHYRYIDSGAMYRAVTLYFLRQQISLSEPQAIAEALKEIEIDFKRLNTINHTILNGEDVEQAIRSHKVNQMVSQVAALTSVRKKLVDQQKKMGKDKRLVMDGRDIGTVVFPEADIKLFMLADIDIRTERRRKELESRGIDVPFEVVQNNLLERDRIDSTREDSPLIKAEDAIILDTSGLSPDEQLVKALQIIDRAVHAKGETKENDL